MKPLIYVHIPKTAGTSLNSCAKELFPDSAIERDYGPESADTSANVKRYIYSDTTVDQFGFRCATKEAETRWITGHFPADRYLHLYGAPNLLSIVRDPAERIVSEYLYLVRQGEKGLKLSDFYQRESETNKQFKMIGTHPWRAYFLVGVQDQYDRCTSLLSNELKLPFEARRLNIAPTTDSEGLVDEATYQAIKDHNDLDYRFVTQVRAYLDMRFKAAEDNQPFCHHEFNFEPGVHTIGWAFYRNNQKPVQVQLWVDGVLKDTCQASEHRPELQLVGAPRMGYCGFRFVLDTYRDAKSIELRTEDTNQLLFHWVPEN